MYTEIDIDAYQAEFADQNGTYQFIDVREVDEYADGRIPGAINIPLSLFEARAGEIRPDQPIVLVCARGGRSAMAAELLAARGYTQLYNLIDGTFGWMMRGLPLEK